LELIKTFLKRGIQIKNFDEKDVKNAALINREELQQMVAKVMINCLYHPELEKQLKANYLGDLVTIVDDREKQKDLSLS
jgi:hypothetical protein